MNDYNDRYNLASSANIASFEIFAKVYYLTIVI